MVIGIDIEVFAKQSKINVEVGISAYIPPIGLYSCSSLGGLTTTQRLSCLLPTYDFSDIPTQNALTPTQLTDLSSFVCDIPLILQSSAIYSNPTYNAALLLNAEYSYIVLQAITNADYSVAGTLAALKLAATYEANVRTDAVATATNAVINTNTTVAHKTYIVQQLTPATLFGNETVAQQDYNSTNIDYSIAGRLTALKANATHPTAIVPDAITNATGQQLNDSITLLNRQRLQRVYPSKTGQTVSYAAGDDGALQNGRGISWTVLADNNPSGNTNRFEASGNNITDWRYGRMWYNILQASTAWANIPAGIVVLNVANTGGYSDWYWNNIDELWLLGNKGISGIWSYAPLNISVPNPYRLWSSTTCNSTTSNALCVHSQTPGLPALYPIAKTTAYQFLLVRKTI